jgi:hypothetical protein
VNTATSFQTCTLSSTTGVSSSWSCSVSTQATQANVLDVAAAQ